MDTVLFVSLLVGALAALIAFFFGIVYTADAIFRKVTGGANASSVTSMLAAATVSASVWVVALLAFPRYEDFVTKSRVSAGNVLYGRLAKGTIVVTAPEYVTQYEEFEVTARVSTRNLAQAVSAEVADVVDPTKEKAFQPDVVLSPRLTAEIIGHDLEIDGPKDNAPRMQPAPTIGDDRVWVWHVRSETSGHVPINIRVQAILKIENNDVPLDFEAPSVRVNVSPSFAGFAERHWEWLVTTLLLPLFGWLIQRFFKSSKSA